MVTFWIPKPLFAAKKDEEKMWIHKKFSKTKNVGKGEIG